MRKRSQERLTHKVFARVTQEKYEELQSLLRQSRCKTLGELVRAILMNQKIITVTYDASLDKLMPELSGIRSQLQGIGRNVNQVTRKLHQGNLSAVQRELLLELVRLEQQTQESVAGLFSSVAKLSGQWLPE